GPLGDELMVQGGLAKDDLTIPDDIHPRDDLCAANGHMERFPRPRTALSHELVAIREPQLDGFASRGIGALGFQGVEDAVSVQALGQYDCAPAAEVVIQLRATIGSLRLTRMTIVCIAR